MRLIQDLRGHIGIVAAGIIVLLVFSIFSGSEPLAYSQLAAVEPSAAEQIWQIGNQPVNYLQDGQTSAQTQGQMWNLNSSYQNIQFQNSADSLQSGQGDVWQTLDTQVQSSEQQVADNPLQGQSTFTSGPAPLSSFEMYDSFNSNQSDQQQSWWSATLESAGNWGTNFLNQTHDFFFGAPDNDTGGPVDTLGIRG